jgi:CBS domain-containing protein
MTKVRDLIGDRSDFYSLPEEATVHDAARYLRDRQVRATAVCDAGGAPVGVIAQSDISDKIAAEHRCPSWVKVGEIMSTQLVTVTPETTVDECLRLMEKHNIYHLLVVERGASLGMVSAQDVLRMVARDEKARADVLETWAFPQADLENRA